MNTMSVKKFSFLGMILIGASAVTAAILPSKSKSDNSRFAANGRLQASANGPSGGNALTCRAQVSGSFSCFDTAVGTGAADSKTTVSGNTSATLTGLIDGNNTTVGDIS